ncbi:MAG: tryptophan synthase subunit alpha [Candidatus Ancillula sp.]|jgi:tryptophan synthase alpha chain|nr:tryptophan synthase subunit alpha [Candidatus Ancillula sp.]
MSKFIGYLPAGFPDAARSISGFKALIDSGADVIEIGVPYSDPVMDGETIQMAGKTALQNGFKIADLFSVIRQVKDYSDSCYLANQIEKPVEIYVMCYYNIVFKYGQVEFAKRISVAGANGVIIPDLIPEEASDWVDAAKRNNLRTVFLTAPNSNAARLDVIAKASSGFIYVSSLLGTTGVRESGNQERFEKTEANVSRVRDALRANVKDTPVYVGLGISSADDAGQVARFADGVIVGSRLVKALQDGEEELRYVAKLIADACHLGWG